jgi:hypothetical protein
MSFIWDYGQEGGCRSAQTRSLIDGIELGFLVQILLDLGRNTHSSCVGRVGGIRGWRLPQAGRGGERARRWCIDEGGRLGGAPEAIRAPSGYPSPLSGTTLVARAPVTRAFVALIARALVARAVTLRRKDAPTPGHGDAHRAATPLRPAAPDPPVVPAQPLVGDACAAALVSRADSTRVEAGADGAHGIPRHHDAREAAEAVAARQEVDRTHVREGGCVVRVPAGQEGAVQSHGPGAEDERLALERQGKREDVRGGVRACVSGNAGGAHGPRADGHEMGRGCVWAADVGALLVLCSVRWEVRHVDQWGWARAVIRLGPVNY